MQLGSIGWRHAEEESMRGHSAGRGSVILHRVNFCFNDDCSNETGQTVSEECYLAGGDIKSLKLAG